MRRIALVALLFAAVPAPALASEKGIYLTADVGAAMYENAGWFPNPAKAGFSVGYRFSRYVAAELGATVFGNSTADIGGLGSATLKAHSVYPSLALFQPITAKTSAFGKLGISSNHASATNTFGVAIRASHSR